MPEPAHVPQGGGAVKIDLLGIESDVALAQSALEGLACVVDAGCLPSVNRMRGNLAAARHALQMARLGTAKTDPPPPDSDVRMTGAE